MEDLVIRSTEEQLRTRLMELPSGLLHCFLLYFHLDQNGNKAQLVQILLSQPFEELYELLDGTANRRRLETGEVKVALRVEAHGELPGKDVRLAVIKYLQDMLAKLLHDSDMAQYRN